MNNEKLKNKLVAFQLMLEGFVNNCKDFCPNKDEQFSILNSYYELFNFIEGEK